MKRLLLGLLGVSAAMTLSAADTALKDQKDKVSYSIGMDIGRNIKRQSLDLNVDALASGIRDMLSGGKTALTDDEAREVMMAYSTEMKSKQQEQSKMAAD